MADIDLVTMRDNLPHCSKHGAMNAVGRYVEDDNVHLIWRCVTTYQFQTEDLHLPVEQRQLNNNPCRAGCMTQKPV